MWFARKSAGIALFFAIAACGATGQVNSNPMPAAVAHRKATHKRALTAADRTSLLVAAQQLKKSRNAGGDCSHLVHAIYSRAGLPYRYADSEDLYAGVREFERVSRPEPGDVIVWHGHAGMVVHPSRHTFFSLLSRGPAVDNYKSRYWKGRGNPRFYRYIKNSSCAECTVAHNRIDGWQ